MDAAVSYVGFGVGIISLVYAFFTNREKAKLEKMIELNLENIAKCVKDVEDNAKLAHTHFDEIRRFVVDQEKSERFYKVVDCVAHAQADITATQRLSRQLMWQVGSMRKALFGINNPDDIKVNELPTQSIVPSQIVKKEDDPRAIASQ